jgi:hypothetical protein
MGKKLFYLQTFTFLPYNSPNSLAGENVSSSNNIIDTLLNLEENHAKEKTKFEAHQQTIKCWFDKKSVGEKDFQVGDLVLKWDKPHEDKGKHSKFQQLWLGPFMIKEKIGQGTYHLQNIEGDIDLLPINGQILKHYIS